MPDMLTRDQELNEQLNSVLFEKLSSRDPILEKEAEDAINAYTRVKMREDGFFRRIMPPTPITNDELDRQVSTDKPVKVVDKEPGSPAAVSIPFATLPMNYYIRGNRYLVMFDRITTPRFTKDVDELRTWHMDIRQVLSDNAIKDMLAEEDSKFLTAVNTALGGSAGATVLTSGAVQWESISGGISRDSLWDMMKIMPSTNSNLEVHTCLTNHITIKEICKFGRGEMGGDMSQDVMKNGWTEQNFMGVRWIITIKKDLVPTNRVYHFADPKFIGKHYSLEDTTLFVKREAYFLEFFAYESMGSTLGHTGGLSAVDFT
jgi:hypothetical protein